MDFAAWVYVGVSRNGFLVTVLATFIAREVKLSEGFGSGPGTFGLNSEDVFASFDFEIP